MNNKSYEGGSIRVNMISESEFSIQGNGVHTAYKEITRALEGRSDIDVRVNTARPSDIVHIQTVGVYSLRQLLSKNGKKVVSAHIVPDSLVGSLRGAKYWKPLAGLWLRFFYGQADLVLACSGMVRDELEQKMKLKKVGLLYNTIDMSQYSFTQSDRRAARKKLGINENEFVVLGNGQVQPRKRLDTFWHIARSMSENRFFWIGGIPFKQLGAEYSSMQKLVSSAPSNLTVTGVIPLEAVRDYYAAADVFVLPAAQENHPMCVLEAAGAGLPIVLRNIPQYNDTFRGYAQMANTDDEFVSLVKKVQSNRQFYDQAKKSSRIIADRFDSKTGAELAVGFYRTLID